MITDIVRELRTCADRVQAMQSDILLPREALTLDEAFTQLRAANPEGYLTIEPTMHWHSKQKGPTVDSWCVYDGKDHHKAKTLARAMALALKAHAPEPEPEPVAVVQAELERCTTAVA